jgi:hypothetical protein
MVRSRRSSVRPNQPLGRSNRSPVTVTKPIGGIPVAVETPVIGIPVPGLSASALSAPIFGQDPNRHSSQAPGPHCWVPP